MIEEICKNGNTVLHFAAANKMEDIYKYLIKSKANPSIKNNMGVTAAELYKK